MASSVHDLSGSALSLSLIHFMFMLLLFQVKLSEK